MDYSELKEVFEMYHKETMSRYQLRAAISLHQLQKYGRIIGSYDTAKWYNTHKLDVSKW